LKISLSQFFQRALNEKIKTLKKSLYQERQSKQTLEKEVTEFREFGNDKFKESWQNISELHAMIQEKEMIIQSLRFNQQKEVDDLKFKLQQRDLTLRKVLESKVSSSKQSGCH
jgi:tRNA G37 N-methylase TrmD